MINKKILHATKNVVPSDTETEKLNHCRPGERLWGLFTGIPAVIEKLIDGMRLQGRVIGRRELHMDLTIRIKRIFFIYRSFDIDIINIKQADLLYEEFYFKIRFYAHKKVFNKLNLCGRI